jgi:hypothetical protein
MSNMVREAKGDQEEWTMHVAQSGIFALGTGSHSYLEFDLLEQAKDNGWQIELPGDHVVADKLAADARTDLVNALLKYPSEPQTGNCTRKSPCAELLRLNLGVDPVQPQQQKRLSVLAGDNAGWPNGRRPNDDVTDIALRVVAGVLVGPKPPASAALKLGDGVNFNIGAEGSNVTANGIYTKFPFLPTPHDGRNRVHMDCAQNLTPC